MNASWIVKLQIGVLFAAWTWLVSSSVAVGQSPEESDSDIERREESMFGPAPEGREAADRAEASDNEGEDSSSSVESSGREAEMFGEEDDSDESTREEDEPSLAERFEERLEVESDPLQLGGTYFGRLNYTVLEEGDPEDFPVSLPNITDLYLDARPTERLRFYTEGRLLFDPTVDAEARDRLGRSGEPVEVKLDQLWLKFDIDRAVYVTVGRQHLRWGVGRFWHPNDFLFAQKRDPLAIFDERTGVDLLKFHVPFEELGWNLYAVAQVDEADAWSEFGGGVRMEFLVGQTELGFAGTYRDRSPLQLGVDVSTGVGPFDLRAAAAGLYGDESTYYRGDFEPETLSDPDPRNWQVPTASSREDEWLFRALAGAEIGFRIFEDDTLYIGGEYFYNEPGYEDEDLYPWLLFQGEFRPFYVGRHYAGLYGSLPAPGRWDDTSFTVSTLSNLSDQSFLSRFDYRLTMLTRLQLYAYASAQYGGSGEFNLRVDLPPIETPGAPPELSEGLTVPAVRARVGLGLQLAF